MEKSFPDGKRPADIPGAPGPAQPGLGGRPALPPEFVWISEQDLDNYGVPRLVEKLFSMVQS